MNRGQKQKRLSPFSLCAGVACLLSLVAWQSVLPLERRFAPITESRCPKPGTTFVWSIGLADTGRLNRWRIARQLEHDCVIQSDAWGDYAWAGALAGDLRKTAAVVDMARQIWPLQVGKHLEWTEVTPEGDWIIDQRGVTLTGPDMGPRNPYQLVSVQDALANGP